MSNKYGLRGRKYARGNGEETRKLKKKSCILVIIVFFFKHFKVLLYL